MLKILLLPGSSTPVSFFIYLNHLTCILPYCEIFWVEAAILFCFYRTQLNDITTHNRKYEMYSTRECHKVAENTNHYFNTKLFRAENKKKCIAEDQNSAL